MLVAYDTLANFRWTLKNFFQIVFMGSSLNLYPRLLFFMTQKETKTNDSLRISISLTREQWTIHSLLLKQSIPMLEQPLWRTAEQIEKKFEASLIKSQLDKEIVEHE